MREGYADFHAIAGPIFREAIGERYSLAEICCGNGNAGRMFQHDAGRLVFVDVKKVRGLDRTLGSIEVEHEVSLEGLQRYEIREDAVIAVHACGTLTDMILEKAVRARAAVAVMPCCYGKKRWNYRLEEEPDPRLLLYPRSIDYIDAVRVQFLKEQGYRAGIRRLDARITPMNNIIIGIPG
ncbi:TPA: methyltransferase [Candidatus Woesearchaeota archaeon]|nr:methyltransferase [Candidatus Woesearchaeota archaeon]